MEIFNKLNLKELRDTSKAAKERISKLPKYVQDCIKLVSQAMANAFDEKLQLLELENKRLLHLIDPMMIAVPKESGLNSKFGFVGPCWGPDFEEIIAEGLNLQKVSGQREFLQGKCRRIYLP